MPFPVKDYADGEYTVATGIALLFLTFTILFAYAVLWLDSGRRDDNDSDDKH